MQANTIVTTPSHGASAPARGAPSAGGESDPFAQMLARQRASASAGPERERSAGTARSAAVSRPEAAGNARPASTSADLPAGTEAAASSDPAETALASELPVDASTSASDAALAQAGASAVAALANPLVEQIQQLTERSRLLADTVVALRTHPTELPAEPAVLVQALQGKLPATLAAESGLPHALTPPAVQELPAALQAPDATPAAPAPVSLAVLPAPTGSDGSAWQLATAPNATALSALAVPAPATESNLQTATGPLVDPLIQPAGTPPAVAISPAPRLPDAEVWVAPLPGSAPAATAAAPAPVTAQVTVPLQSPHWSAAFSQQIVHFGADGRQGLRQIELRLDPPDLGPVRISLNLAGEQASAWFVSPHAAVRHAIEQALPQLQQALADAGIQLGQASVGEHANPEQAEARAQGGGEAHEAGGHAHDDTGTAIAQATPARPRGLIDTFA